MAVGSRCSIVMWKVAWRCVRVPYVTSLPNSWFAVVGSTQMTGQMGRFFTVMGKHSEEF